MAPRHVILLSSHMQQCAFQAHFFVFPSAQKSGLKEGKRFTVHTTFLVPIGLELGKYTEPPASIISQDIYGLMTPCKLQLVHDLRV